MPTDQRSYEDILGALLPEWYQPPMTDPTQMAPLDLGEVLPRAGAIGANVLESIVREPQELINMLAGDVPIRDKFGRVVERVPAEQERFSPELAPGEDLLALLLEMGAPDPTDIGRAVSAPMFLKAMRNRLATGRGPTLFHGTSASNIPDILSGGFRRMDEAEAIAEGARRAGIDPSQIAELDPVTQQKIALDPFAEPGRSEVFFTPFEAEAGMYATQPGGERVNIVEDAIRSTLGLPSPLKTAMAKPAIIAADVPSTPVMEDVLTRIFQETEALEAAGKPVSGRRAREMFQSMLGEVKASPEDIAIRRIFFPGGPEGTVPGEGGLSVMEAIQQLRGIDEPLSPPEIEDILSRLGK